MNELQWLDFDYSEGDDEVGVFDALACVLPEHADAVRAEIEVVLAWAQAEGGRRAPVEEGGEWDADLQVGDEDSNPPRRLFSLSIGGSAAFCQAFGERFGDSDDD